MGEGFDVEPGLCGEVRGEVGPRGRRLTALEKVAEHGDEI